MDETELIINAATLFAKDLVVDNQNSQKLFLKMSSLCPSSVQKDTRDFDDNDLDLILFTKLMNKKRQKRRMKIENHITEINPMDLLDEVRRENKRQCRRDTDTDEEDNDDVHDDNGPGQPSEPPPPLEMKNQFFQFLNDCDDLTFENHFKLTKKTFITLQMTLDPILEPYMRNTNLTKFQIIITTLWLLTTEESISSVAERFGLAKEQCQRALKLMCEAIAKSKHLFIKWPNSKQSAQILKKFNETNDEHRFPNVCGIIGCASIEVASPANIQSRKSIVKLQCVCDSDGLFINCYVEVSQICSNVLVFNRSPVKTMLDKNPYALPSNSHLLGDQSYPLRTFLMVPFKEHRRSLQMSEYNRNLESKRKLIDREFCRLLERFSRLKFINMQISPELIQCIEMACCLHNFCIQQNDSYYLQIEDESPVNACREICRDFTMDQRALDKRQRILKQFADTPSNN